MPSLLTIVANRDVSTSCAVLGQMQAFPHYNYLILYRFLHEKILLVQLQTMACLTYTGVRG